MMDIDELIQDDRERGLFRVHRSSMTSQAVFDLEQRNIFDRCWLYLGHDSEVPGPGDFLRREVAGRPLFFMRGRDGTTRVFYNTCPHRGARICRQDTGNARVFQCFYHAWTFNTEGELIGVPDEEGFGPSFSRSRNGLRSPRHESYRGFHFVSFSPDGESLEAYLGEEVTEYIDLLLDQSAVGMRVVPGEQRYAARANWKLMVENSSDGYHFLPTHETLMAFLATFGEDRGKQLRSAMAVALDVGNGHWVMEHPTHFGRTVALWHESMGPEVRREIDQKREELIRRLGETRAQRIAERGRAMLIYPNLIILDQQAPIVRTIWPVAPDEHAVTAWTMAPADETPTMMKARLSLTALAVGPGGFTTPDDIEAVEACQQGFRAREVEWSEISRGIGMEPQMMYEQQIRAFWREWHANVRGELHADHTPDTLPLKDQTAVATL